MICPYCQFASDGPDDFDEDFQNHQGYWCPECDGFIGKKNQKYILYREDKNLKMNVKKTKLKKHVSPLRYPGGKSRMIDYVVPLIKKREVFVEPFTGGASVAISLLLSNTVDNIVLNDIDFGWYSLFYQILYNTKLFCNKIELYHPDKADYKKKQVYILNGYLNRNMDEAAMAFLVVNRCAFSGIPYASCKSNIDERWNPTSLIKRIKAIANNRERIKISNLDAMEVIKEYYWNPQCTLFIDPPYIEKGSILYLSSFSWTQHIQLSELLESLNKEYPNCADTIITYDNQDILDKMYPTASIKKVGTGYSISRTKGEKL